MLTSLLAVDEYLCFLVDTLEVQHYPLIFPLSTFHFKLFFVFTFTSRIPAATFFRGTRCGVRCLVNIPVVGKINIDSLAVTCKLPITVKQ